MRFALLLTVIGIAATACQMKGDSPPVSSPAAGEYQPGVAASAEQVKPISVGQSVPDVTLETVAGKPIKLSKVYAAKPTVLVTYRGGWCPYCNTQLAELAKNEAKLREMGFQIIGISPDRPAELAKSIDKENLNYTLLSDSDAELAKAFGLAFKVDDPTIKKYKTYGIDLQAASGYDHHLLPVPAVYLIDTNGKIRYAFWDANYKNRLSGDQLLKAAQAF